MSTNGWYSGKGIAYCGKQPALVATPGTLGKATLLRSRLPLLVKATIRAQPGRAR